MFSLDTPDAFQFYYNPLRAADRNTGMEKMAEQIATLCSTLGEYPSIRYRLVLTILIGLDLTSSWFNLKLNHKKTILTFLMLIILTINAPYGRINCHILFCRCLALVSTVFLIKLARYVLIVVLSWKCTIWKKFFVLSVDA